MGWMRGGTDRGRDLVLDLYFRKIVPSQMMYLLFAAFIMGTLAMSFKFTGLPFHADKIMIGDIMLLIPGLLMTNAVRDIFPVIRYRGCFGFANRF